MNREAILAALQPTFQEVQAAGGAVVVQVKDLTVREREAWRTASAGEDGQLKPDWLLQLLSLAVHDGDGAKLWPTAADVDGPDAIISELAQAVLRQNGLAADSQKEAQGN